MQTCTLYDNQKPPEQQMFVAAAAMYYITGNADYRTQADEYWDESWYSFLFNWNNVPAQVRHSNSLCLSV